MQVGEADLLAEDLEVALGEVPKVFDVEQDLGGCRVVVGEFGAVGAARKKAEDIGRKTLRDHVGCRRALVVHRHAPGEGADLRG